MNRRSSYGIVAGASLAAVLLVHAVPQRQAHNWTDGGNLTVAREGACAVALADGRVLVIGGRTADGASANVDVLAAQGGFSTAATMAIPRSGLTCSLMPNGTVLAGGGASDGGPVNGSEIYDPKLDQWSFGPSMMEARSGHTASVLHDGRVLIAGGDGSQGPVNTIEIYDLTTGKFSAAGL